MKNSFKGFVVALGAVAVMAAGCAKEEVIKKDEPVVEQQTVVAPPPPPVELPAPAPAPVVQEEAAVKASEVVQLETVYFDFDKSDLRQDTRDVLSRNAEAILKSAGSRVKIEGHCDERGSDEYNLALGDRRANSVAQYLINLGVSADKISTISFGKEKPAVDGSNEAAWSKNRRAEFVVE